MANRSSLSKKLRFEIFKRDKFTCQYCGQKAPDVVLHADHVIAVADGGTDDPTNLVAACVDCNGGKGARPLSDTAVLEKQRKEVELQADRIEQIRMLAAWHIELSNMAEQIVQEFSAYLTERFGNHFIPNDNGTDKLRKLIKRFDAKLIFQAIDECADSYLRLDADGKTTSESWNKAFNMIPNVAYNLKTGDTSKKEIAYIGGICRNRFGYFNQRAFYTIINYALPLGLDLQWAKYVAKEARSWTQFRNSIQEFIDQHSQQEAQPETA